MSQTTDGTILDRIVETTRRDLKRRRAHTPLRDLERQLANAPPVRDFRAALETGDSVQIIAEVKKASPSAGVLRPDFDAVAIACTYAEHGAAAISVLTDEPFFQGSLHYLTAIRQAVAVPLLRKDFLIDPYQVYEARVAGADAVLLIAEILDDVSLADLLATTRNLGMQSLVECYEPRNLDRILATEARLIGINNRDLRTFITRLEHTLELATRLPSGCCLVSESGIRSHADLLRLHQAGVQAVLVGETFMRAADIGAQLDELRGVRR